MITNLNNDTILQLAKSVIQINDRSNLHFSKITTEEDWFQLGQFRKNNYHYRKSYISLELDNNGIDSFDSNSLVYASWLNNKIAASIRLCPTPFESSRFIPSNKLEEFLGPDYQNVYLEWTRLLVAPTIKIPFFLNALIIYSAIKTMTTYCYQKYFGYSTPIIKRLFSRFQMENKVLEFKIPHRGSHSYYLFKGCFMNDYKYLIQNSQ
jgi:hypothetical protein